MTWIEEGVMLMSHFIFQTVRNTSFRLYSRPSSVTDGKQRDRNHPFLTPSMQGSAKWEVALPCNLKVALPTQWVGWGMGGRTESD